MFLYLLNEEEGKAFMELASLAMKINSEIKSCEAAEYDNYLSELNLVGYKVKNLSLSGAATVFKLSSKQVKRSVIVELCGILYADKEIDSNETEWIYSLANEFALDKPETERLVRWSKDFTDFLEVGLMYINNQ